MNSQKDDAPGHNQEFRIIVNARERIVTERKLTYDQVVSLAFPNPDYEKTEFTVTYKKGDDKKPEGSMVQGDSVHIKSGMIFNVTPTDKS